MIVPIIGRPNVGKSTLFNRLTSSRDALVADRPGLTRDRQYGLAHSQGRRFLFVDTGGIGDDEHDSKALAELMREQVLLAMEEAGLLLWVLDGRGGLNATDLELADTFRRVDKPVMLLVNKLEGMDGIVAVAEFHRLGFAEIFPVSAKHGDGMAKVWAHLRTCGAPRNGSAVEMPDGQTDHQTSPRATVLGILGRPNVGKSTLVNHILGEQRVLTQDQPGTTRDSIRVPFRRQGRDYVLIDTAGVRRRRRIDDAIEKLSVAQSLFAIDQADVVLFLVDAREDVTEQDRALLGLVVASGRSLIIAVNKCDGLQEAERRLLEQRLQRKCRFVDYARMHYISALRGSGVGELFKSVRDIRRSLRASPSASAVTGILHQATTENPPPMVRGRRIKLRYAHLGGARPVRVIIHGNQTRHLPAHYLRYLARAFREQLRLVATPVLVECRQNDNPYQPPRR